MNDEHLADAIKDQSIQSSHGVRLDDLENAAHTANKGILDNFHDTRDLKSAVGELAFRVRILVVAVVITAPLALIGAGLAIWEAVTS
jgi:hypothetical protein